ncbi:ribonuclease H-like protein, partial [Dendrothele bispora CBS 962.96]
RTSQRAELLGVLAGLDMFTTLDMEERLEGDREDYGWVICTDSEYVVKGITEYYPAWRANDWMRSNSNEPPANLDLFHKLDATLRNMEERRISVGFWRIPREHNRLADQLAAQGSF